MYQQVGCARNRLRSDTVQQKPSFSLLMQFHAWMEYQLLIFGIWLKKYFIPYRTEQMDPRESHGEVRRQLSSQTCITHVPLQNGGFRQIPSLTTSALDLWDFVIEVFHSSPNQLNNTKDQVRRNSSRNTTSIKHTQSQTKVPAQHNNFESSNVDYVSSNAKSSLFGSMLYISEDNEAVIKMIINGRSPTMRHESRTHRVALDWLLDRINLDSKIQIRYIDTKHQLADILTKGNFTRDEWNNILLLLNISHFSTTCCAKNSRLISCSKKMAKRMQEQKGEERIVGNSRPTAMNLSSSVPASSSSAKNLITSSDLGKLVAVGKRASKTRRNSKPDEAPSSQMKLKDVYLGGLMDEIRGNLSQQRRIR